MSDIAKGEGLTERLRLGISRLRGVDRDKLTRNKLRAHLIGYVHVNLVEVRTRRGKL